MNIVNWHFLELGNPLLDELASRIEFLALAEDVEIQSFAGAQAGGEVPRRVVWLGVVVD